jgi:hypothetical protein
MKNLLNLKNLLFAAFLVSGIAVQAQNSWTQKADFSGVARDWAIGFSIGDKGYIGLGEQSQSHYPAVYADFWEWEPITDTWVAKAPFPGTARIFVKNFSIGNNGYVIGGKTTDGTILSDIWEWNQQTDTWIQKSSYPSTDLACVAFSIGNNGYVATSTKHFFQWNQSTDSWIAKADFPGLAINGATGFSIDNKGYIGTGMINGVPVNEFWEYNPANDSWSRKADVGGSARAYAFGFSIAGNGYIGTGNTDNGLANDFWEYDATANTWNQKANCGDSRENAISFSIGNKGYMGTGGHLYSEIAFEKDFWEFNTTGTATGLIETGKLHSISIFPNPSTSAFTLNNPSPTILHSLKVYNSNGKEIVTRQLVAGNNEIDVTAFGKGIYFLEISGGEKTEVRRVVLN